MTGFAVLTVLATAVLFVWGIRMGLKGLYATHRPFKGGAHAPGGVGTYDPLYLEMRKEKERKAA